MVHGPGHLLVITGGHSFDQSAFAEMINQICSSIGWTWEQGEQPAAQQLLRPSNAGVWDAILLYDLPGLRLARGEEPEPVGPTEAVKAGIRGLVAAGQGFVALHHALAGWPVWDEWAQMLGGRFLYAPGSLNDATTPASGYRMGSYLVESVNPGHPVCAGVESFELTDELYLCPVFEQSVVPLLRTSASTAPRDMIDTHREVLDGERHPAPDQPGSPYLGWETSSGDSRTVYLLPGHGPQTMANRSYQRLVANALQYVSPLGVDESQG